MNGVDERLEILEQRAERLSRAPRERLFLSTGGDVVFHTTGGRLTVEVTEYAGGMRRVLLDGAEIIGASSYGADMYAGTVTPGRHTLTIAAASPQAKVRLTAPALRTEPRL